MATDLGTLLVRVGITGVREVKTSLGQVGDAAQATSQKFSVLQGAASTMLGVLGSGVVSSIAKLPAMLLGAAGSAVKLSNEFESIEVGLQAITGSAETAAQKMSFIKQLAVPSELTARQLAQAGMMIEGMGLRMERVLPLVTKLTMGTRRVGEEYQRMAVGSVFGRLAQGMMPEIEALSSFGISRAALAQYGAVFGPNGELLSGAETSLNAIEKLINTRFGRALELAANTGQARLSALADMWEQAVARLGEALKRFVMPVVERLGEWLKWLQESGWLNQLAERLGAVFGNIGSNALGPIDTIMATVLAVAERLPQLLKVAGEWFGVALNNATAGLVMVVDMLSSGAIGSLARAQAHEAWAATGLSFNRAGRLRDAAAWREVAASQMAEAQAKRDLNAKRMAKGFSAIPSEAGIPERRNAILQEFAKARASGALAGGLPQDQHPELGWGNLIPAIARTAHATGETARNTRSMAESLRDLRATVWGGGRRTHATVSSIEAQIALARALGYGIG